jgi:hypothetical protein
MAKVLEAWLVGERVSAYDDAPRVVLQRLLRRHRVLSAVATAALLGLLLVCRVASWRVPKEGEDARAMATVFLKDVREKLARTIQSAEVLEPLSRSAIEVYASSLDLESGPREDRLLRMDVWLDIAASRWSTGQSPGVAAALSEAEAALGPLERQRTQRSRPAGCSTTCARSTWRSLLDRRPGSLSATPLVVRAEVRLGRFRSAWERLRLREQQGAVGELGAMAPQRRIPRRRRRRGDSAGSPARYRGHRCGAAVPRPRGGDAGSSRRRGLRRACGAWPAG